MKKMTREEFIERSSKIHHNKYNYDAVKFINSQTPVSICCPLHGQFTQMPFQHYKQSGTGCPLCGKQKRNLNLKETNRERNLLSTEYFVERANGIHDNRYDYSQVQYMGNRIPVEIICKEHGPFFQRPDKHLGHGMKKPSNCPECSNQSRKLKLKGNYTDLYFRLNKDKKELPALLYLVRAVDKDEDFYKIGITTTSVKTRFKSGYKAYNFTTVLEISLPLYQAFLKEQEILKFLQGKHYTPSRPFGGHTECFPISIEQTLIQKFNEVINNPL